MGGHSLAALCRSCEAVGTKADAADWRVAKCNLVADDEAAAQRYGKSAEGPYHF